MNIKSNNRIIKVLLWVSLAMNAFMLLVIANHFEKKGGINYLRMRFNHQSYSTNSYISFYYKMKTGTFREMPADSNAIIILGNSIADYCDWAEMLSNPLIKNRGIGGDDIIGIYNRVDQVTDASPSKIIFMLDPKDLVFERPIDTISSYYEQIIRSIRNKCPDAGILCMSMIPANNTLISNDSIAGINERIRIIAGENNAEFIDVYHTLCKRTNKLDSLYSFDGEHLNGKGYKLLSGVIRQFIDGQEITLPAN
ncbi:GDSL-type esterase/lipase family protein [Lentimicrobium sp.]|uniref:GDSL-type esterase/lipase family protein n=1 Tax=Lentimicrobium sp. TaxID=2034841 RepID=UPI0025F537D7|nr:GDSL-type esterase/lipase family protein [Lentimicrobium sp.]MCO5255638.1 GDSL-type esterase/lipase family protein [Lentimicrobium sp.]MCO5261548.1 GDSL-type esterase/lipase family protein [Lentimicrobium sp.]HPR26323.1 GDSL-type esterase/lipase family protein [Lentimicrobium sp.]